MMIMVFLNINNTLLYVKHKKNLDLIIIIVCQLQFCLQLWTFIKQLKIYIVSVQLVHLSPIMPSQIKKQNFFWNQINPNVEVAQYAVRGQVPTLATSIKQELDAGSKKYPFDEVTFCNIGNPQAFNQKPLTFNREVLSCMINPQLIESKAINPDAADRARRYLKQITSVGSYTHSMGVKSIRKSIAKFISTKDKVEQPSVDNIFLTQGASQGVHVLLNCMITCNDDAVMIPIPQYPLYSAAIALYGGTAASYYLNQEREWQLDLEELQRSYNEYTSKGKKIKALVVINPGNPTGAIFNQQTITKIIEFAVDKKIVVIADEVYRENIYKDNTKFYSCRSVLDKMSANYRNNCQMASLHSISKGLLGQCGLRGGYLYLHNFNQKVWEQIVKLKSINLCSNSIGQFMVELMVNPPAKGEVSDKTYNQYQEEYAALFASMKRRAKLVTQALKQMKNVHVNEIEGAMYAFPSITFSEKAKKAAGKMSPDLFYCLQVLKNTGITLVPGSGFKQKSGTYHFRITILVRPEEKLQEKLTVLKKFNDQFHAKYQDKANL